MSKANRFGEYIANLRMEKNIYLTQLSDGLCDYTMLSRFERGEREPDKLLQNRLLTRLGAVPENYENFLYYSDYCRWEKRQGILHHILEENMEEAKKQLKEYYKTYDMTMPLEMQFYLAMLAQIRQYEGAERKELAELFEQALDLTVPGIKSRGIEKRILSLEELNLLLEQVYCEEERKEVVSYEAILTYIKQMKGTKLAMAKIFPKTVYYYYLNCRADFSKDAACVNKMLTLCNEAIELLRNANRMFYLWELFLAKEDLMQYLPKTEQRKESWKREFEECRTWRLTLEEVYKEYGVSIAMYEFCYLYVESENYCIGDVIRIRRKMLGMSQRQLSAGICAERTVSRLERNLTEPQREVVRALFDRLNLSTELNRTELVTDNPEAIEKYRELKRQNNNRDFEKVKILLDELSNTVSLSISSNRQALLRNHLINEFNIGNLSETEFVRDMKKALDYTVPYYVAIKRENKYLTTEEISCLQNIALKAGMSSIEKEQCVLALKSMCETPKYSGNYFRLYEFIMTMVSNYFGNKGNYKEADRISVDVLRKTLRYRRIGCIHTAIYDLLWNKEHSLGDIDLIYKMRELDKCIQMSSLRHDFYYMQLYEKKKLEIKFLMHEQESSADEITKTII